MSRSRIVWRVLSTVGILLVLIGGLEAALRVVSWIQPLVYYRVLTKPWMAQNSQYVVWHLPNARTEESTECFRASYTSNRFGMRDKPRTQAGESSKPRVAVLGDSYTEGMGVNDSETFTRVLEDQLFHGRVEFLNFGRRGFGTVQEWVQYTHLARTFHPSIVLLMFFHGADLGNDLTDNSWWFVKRIPNASVFGPFLIRKGDRYELFYPTTVSEARPRDPRWTRMRDRLVTTSYILRYLFAAHQRFTHGIVFRGEMSEANVYRTDPPGHWRDSWEITAEALHRLHTAVRSDGATLVVVDVPAYEQMDPHVAAQIVSQPGVDLMFPERRLAQIVSHLEGARFFSLRGPFLAYRDAHHLRRPYFAFSCDAHWSALGHRVAAQAIANYLVTSGLLGVEP